ncbi:hypothetical protein T492DRAFT_847643 [Pavlovales sp. CCMP2436]|nr:hypothetical protein T492DRAFT_847643 [Pavlovales sp. CCMP2436]
MGCAASQYSAVAPQVIFDQQTNNQQPGATTIDAEQHGGSTDWFTQAEDLLGRGIAVGKRTSARQGLAVLEQFMADVDLSLPTRQTSRSVSGNASVGPMLPPTLRQRRWSFDDTVLIFSSIISVDGGSVLFPSLSGMHLVSTLDVLKCARSAHDDAVLQWLVDDISRGVSPAGARKPPAVLDAPWT